MALPFNELVSSLTGAVIEAQHQLRRDNISELYNHFEKDGSPISVDLKIPSVSYKTGSEDNKTEPEGDKTRSEDHNIVTVPLIILTNHSQLSIQEMQVTMLIDTSEITKPCSNGGQSNGSNSNTGVQPHKWESLKRQTLIHASTTTGGKQGDIGTAQVILKMTAGETPEGLAKLLNHLNKGL